MEKMRRQSPLLMMTRSARLIRGKSLPEEESYQVLLTQPADVVIYVQSIVAELSHLMKMDFHIVSRILSEYPQKPPIFTLLNDMYCGDYGTLLAEEELTKYVIPSSRVFRTAIRYLPASKNCATGADEVFDELLKICKVT
ncbi:MAG: hypothetical protein GY801_01860 [bacterium]|nr:hypothetical protein [bacterium]